MPIFEYTCPDCRCVFEKLVLTRENKGLECPKCGSEQVEQILSAFATTGSGKAAPGSCAPSGGG